MEVGKEYLFFLWEPAYVGPGYNTRGDYYAIVYQNIGLFKADSDTTETADGKTVPSTFSPYYSTAKNNESIEYVPFIEEMDEYNNIIPINKRYFAEKAEEALKSNLDRGYISQEEFDRSIEQMSQYGTVLYYTEPSEE